MKINWLAIVLWALILAFGAGAYYGWTHMPAEKVVTPPAQTMPVQPPVIAPPPSPNPRYRAVTKPKTTKKPAHKRAYSPAYKQVPHGPLVDCNQVPQVARTLPWNQVQSAALQRGMSAAQIAELKTCMSR
jgi:hypothetical protein